ncbi:MAG: hypothetical protein LBT14_09720, partial [Treponema sp.]|nr:hypothetical protein [Treponema sp.]
MHKNWFIEWEVYNVEINEKYNLGVKLDFNMPENFEDAFGSYNAPSHTLFFNIKWAVNENIIPPLFTVVHEMRHALHYHIPESFSSMIRRSCNYAIIADIGIAYKLDGNKWLECKLEGTPDYLNDLYLLSPNELDANKYAFDYLQELLKDFSNLIEKLNEYYDSWKPKHNLIPIERVDDELEKIYDY